MNSKQSKMNGFEKEVKRITGWDRYWGHSIPYTQNYIPDFQHLDYVVEAKGYFMLVAVNKTLAVLKSNPDIDLRFVFQKPDSKLGGRKRMTCRDFAEKHGLYWTDINGLKKGEWYGGPTF